MTPRDPVPERKALENTCGCRIPYDDFPGSPRQWFQRARDAELLQHPDAIRRQLNAGTCFGPFRAAFGDDGRPPDPGQRQCSCQTANTAASYESRLDLLCRHGALS
jgi:hypothetical protein